MVRKTVLVLIALLLVAMGSATTWLALSVPNDIRAESLLRQARTDLNRNARAEARERLRTVVEQKLPEPLRRYEAVAQLQLAAALEDPVEFAQCFHTAL